MQISKDNYGAFFLDYRESNLDDRGKEALAEFLRNNPDLQNEFLDFINLSDIELSPERSVTFSDKHKLKRLVVDAVDDINQDNFDEYIIAFLENDLTDEQIKVFERFKLKNPAILKEIEWYKKTFLKPDKQIFFAQKAVLKRRYLSFYNPSIIKSVASLAALIILTFGLLRLTTNFFTHQRSSPGIAVIDAIKDEPYQENPVYGDIFPNQPALAQMKRIDGLVSLKSIVNVNVAQVIEKRRSFVEYVEFPVQEHHGLLMNRLEVAPLPISLVLAGEKHPSPLPRNEFSQIFDYLLLRDGLALEAEKETGFFGRLIAGLGKRIQLDKEQPIEQFINPVFESVTGRGKELLGLASGIIPFYQTIDETGRKETFLAVNENFNILISRNKTAE
jgi:hypothetical protein